MRILEGIIMATPEITVERVDVVEGDGSGTDLIFQVRLSVPSVDAVTVDYYTRPGTALDNDFSNLNYLSLRTDTLTIAAGETVGQITVRALGDDVDEVDESMWLNLFNPTGAVLAGGEQRISALGVVQDDDGNNSNLSMFVSSPEITEGENGTKTALFEINLSRASDTEQTFTYQTVDGTAKAGEDYVAKTGTVTFLAGETTATVAVDVKGDSVTEPSEFFSFVVNPTEAIANHAAGSTGVATIMENDASSSSLPVATIERVDETEGDQRGGYIVFQVTLSEATANDVTFDYQARAGTAIDDDFSNLNYLSLRVDTLKIAAGDTTGLIYVYTSPDDTDETDESMWLDLFNPNGAVLAGNEKKISALGVVRDDDGNNSNLAMFVSSPEIAEGNSGSKKAVFEIHLSQPSDTDLTFSYQTVDGTATAGDDYTAKTGTVTFLAGQTTAAVEVAVKGDKVVEPTESFSLVVTPTNAIANGAAGSTGIATIMDDDTGKGSLPIASIKRADVTEGDARGGYLVFEVTLSEATANNVTIDYQARPGTATSADFSNLNYLTLRTGTLTIAAGDTTGLIYVQATPNDINDVDEYDESMWLDLYNPTGAVLAGGDKKISAIGIVQDDDGNNSNLSMFVSSQSVAESDDGAKTAAFEIHLSRAYATDVTFTYQTSDGTAKAGSDYVAEKGSVTFLAGQTVAAVHVDIKGDGLNEANEYFSLVVKPPQFLSHDPAAHVGRMTIVNDDSINETIRGTKGNDRLFGQEGNDTLFGLDKNDQLDGGKGHDVLWGGNGLDKLIGGAGSDDLHGGAGKDMFIFKSASETTVKASGRDEIFDFSAKEKDRIDLSDIDANSKAKGNQHFDFIGTNDFTKTAGELHYAKQGHDVIVSGDINGDGKADFALLVDDTQSLNASSFLL